MPRLSRHRTASDMTLRFTPGAASELGMAHTRFVGTPEQATYDRIVRTLAELDIAPGLFALVNASELPRSKLPATLRAYQVIHEVQPKGPNASITFILSTEDEDVTVSAIVWG